MPTPRTSTRLLETSSGSAVNDAPKAGTVLVIGSAGQGPTTPQIVLNSQDAYALYGTEGTLAQEISVALAGARLGAQVAGTGTVGQVIAIRTDTGLKASATLEDAAADPSLILVAQEASDLANGFRVASLDGGSYTGYSIYDPITGQTVQFTTDPLADEGVTDLAQRIVDAFGGRITAEVVYNDNRFEIEVDRFDVGTDSEPVVSYAGSGRSVLDLSVLSEAALEGLFPDSTLWLDKSETNSITGTDFNKLLAPDNADARFYAVSAGPVLGIPKGSARATVPNLAPSTAVGIGVQSLLNIRTSGVGLLDYKLTSSADPAPGAATTITTAAYDALPADAGAGVTGKEDYEAVVAIPLTDAAERSDAAVAEGYFRVRNQSLGQLVSVDVTATHDFGSGAVASLDIEFAAPQGIADDGTMAAAYAADHGAITAAEASDDRLGGTVQFQVFGRELGGETLNEVTGVTVEVVWVAGVATLHIDKTEFDSVTGGIYEEGELFVSYETCTFDIKEKTPGQLNPNATGLEFAATSGAVEFNRALEHELIVRPLRITHYRLGDTLTVERVERGAAVGNAFHFHGENQPGEANRHLGDTAMSSVFGFEYTIEPNLPVIDPALGYHPFSGGTSGANADAETRIAALKSALELYGDTDYKTAVSSDLWVDSASDAFDAITGVRTKQPVGLLDVFADHQAAQSQTGASGVVYASVRPMLPATISGLYTASIKEARTTELTVPDATQPARVATILSGSDYPQAVIFDAPAVVNLQGRRVTSTSGAFWAGMRSALPNNRTLYQIPLPESIVQPLYRYNVPGRDLPSTLSDARINTWSQERGRVVLADERTAAAAKLTADGRLEESSFRSAPSLYAVKEFLQRGEKRLSLLLGPIPTGGAEVLRSVVVTELRSVGAGVVGVEDVIIDDREDVTIRSLGGTAVEMDVRVWVQVNGELRKISLAAAAVTDLTSTQTTSSSTIRVAE